VKREKYGVKELARLKKTLGITDDDKPNKDEIMEDINTITLSVDANTIKKTKSKKTTMKIINQDEDSDMEEEIVVKKDGESEPRVYNTKTMRDQFGQYPIWMSQRKIKLNKQPLIKKDKQNTHKISKNKRKSKSHRRTNYKK